MPAADAQAAGQYASNSTSLNTKKAYASDWRNFTQWCSIQTPPATPLPATPQTVALYLTSMAQVGYAWASIRRVLSTISQAHKLANAESNPTQHVAVKKVLGGIRRTIGAAPKNAKDPIRREELVRLLDAVIPPAMTHSILTLRQLRDRALILLGFTLAARRSELVAIKLDDVKRETRMIEGKPVPLLHVRSVKSKTNQTGEIRWKVIGPAKDPKLCPLRAIDAYLSLRGTEADEDHGPYLFCGLSPDEEEYTHGFAADGREVARILKRYAEVAGLDPTKFAGHSLRAGFVTESLLQGLSVLDIIKVTEHTSVDMLKRYDRRTAATQTPLTGKLL